MRSQKMTVSLLAAVTVDRVDHLGDVLLGQFLVADVERHVGVLRQEFADEHTARRGFIDLRHRLPSASTVLKRPRILACSVTDLVSSA